MRGRLLTRPMGNSGSISPSVIDDEIDSHLNLPARTSVKQFPYRPILINIVENGDMEDGPLIPSTHFFTNDTLDASINPNHDFGDDTARDTYFSAHPGELTDGLLIYSWYRYQKYISSAWVDQDTYELILGLTNDYFTDNPSELIVGALRCYSSFEGPLYEKYTGSAWVEMEYEDLAGGWVPGMQGSVLNLVLTSDTTEKHSGTKSIKTVFNLDGYSDFYGGGIQIQGVDLTNATQLSIWVKGAGDAIGKQICELIGGSTSQPHAQTITGNWYQYTFEVPVYDRIADQTIGFIVGENYANIADNYEVYWDDCTLTGPAQNELVWAALDTYFNALFFGIPSSDSGYTEKVYPVFEPAGNLLEEADFPTDESTWDSYTYSSAGVTPAISNVVTTIEEDAHGAGINSRQIACTIASDGSSAPAIISHRQIFTDPYGEGDGTVWFRIDGPHAYLLTGVTASIEKIGTDGTTVLGVVTLDISDLWSDSWGQFSFSDLDAIAEGDWGGIGFRVNVASTAYMGAYTIEIAQPSVPVTGRVLYQTKAQILAGHTHVDADLPVTTMRFRGSAASDPTNSRAGDCYLKTGDSKLYMHNGTSYIALT